VSEATGLRLRAHAKLNLALRVGPPGADGFHPLATVLQTISLCDLLYARKNDAATEILTLTAAGAVLPAENTVTRAVALLAERLRADGVEPVPLNMHLEKRVPSGAGLGGGSSDAVAALAACLRLWDVDRQWAQDADLRRIAAAVGSDVPFFLTGGTALGSGRGDRIEALEPLRSTWFCVAAPLVHVSTPRAYAAYDGLMAQRRDSAASASMPSDGGTGPSPPDYRPEIDPSWMGNDLAEAVAAAHPEVEDVRRALAGEGARSAQMTGSGAASFGAFDDRRAALRAARALRGSGYWAGAFVSVTSRQHLPSLRSPGSPLLGR